MCVARSGMKWMESKMKKTFLIKPVTVTIPLFFCDYLSVNIKNYLSVKISF